MKPFFNDYPVIRLKPFLKKKLIPLISVLGLNGFFCLLKIGLKEFPQDPLKHIIILEYIIL